LGIDPQSGSDGAASGAPASDEPAAAADSGASRAPSPLEAFLNDGGFSFERLVAAAEAAAAGRLRLPGLPRPQFAGDIDYDGFRRIEFRRESGLWADQGLGFETQFAHPGWLYTEPVSMFEAADGVVRQIDFDPSLFIYRDEPIERAVQAEAGSLGFAGARLLTEINRPGKLDEVIAFQGASYFRALGRNSRYGLSARGLALDTGAPSGEEFPRFSALVLQRPSYGSMATLYALLESASVYGAYAFSIAPGVVTKVDVDARLFPRRNVGVLGLAPLTSMYAFGENDRVGVDDFRPEVHDSDGLLIRTGAGEVIWRPVTNPPTLQISSFLDHNPRGFGLFQRDRAFASYQDVEARYDRRPSCWVEPLEPWGAGAVRLVEIPTRDEYNDNIVAFWAPEGGLKADQPLALRYRLHWGDAPPGEGEAARVVSTRTGPPNFAGEFTGREASAHERKFVIDFEGGLLTNLPPDAVLEAAASGNAVVVTHSHVSPLPGGRRWRAVVDVRRDVEQPTDLRCYLRIGRTALSETWSYLWS
jgi:glucans biosynthesis protein